jgi:type IV secretory pathway VirB4 component
MKNNTFPVIEINKNESIDIEGNKSTIHEIECIDFSQYSDREIDSFLDNIERSFNSMEANETLRFYQLNARSFIQLNIGSNYKLPMNTSPSRELLEIFFKEKDIFSDVGIYDDYISFNGCYRRILSVCAFSSEEIDYNLIRESLNYILDLKKIDQNISLKKLDQIRRLHQGSYLKSRRDIESEGAYDQSESLIEDLTNQTECLFDIEMYIIVDALSLEELNNKTMDVVQYMKLKGVELYIEGHSLKKIKSGLGTVFSSLVPGVKPKLKLRNMPDKTSHLTRLLPLSRSHFMSEGIEFHDSFNNTIRFNPFNEEFKNKNMLVTGSSGGGKSVFVNKLIHSLIDDHPTVILDKGGSFKKICLYHDGVNLEGGINPMHFKDAVFLREFILSIVDKKRFQKLEKGLLLKRIKIFLQAEKEQNFFDLVEFLEKDFEGISLYFEDIKDFITEVDYASKSILYVDIENFPKHQVAPLIIYVLEYFKSLKAKEKILVFDEAWEFLKEHSSYIDESFRTLRKTGAFLIAVSQGITDFKSIGELYNSIINNSFFKVYFPQDYINEPHTSEFDNERIESLSFEKGYYSECYIKTQDNKYRKVLRLYLTPLEKELFHTEAHKSDSLFKFYEDHKEYFETNKDVIDGYVRLHHENS